MNQRSTPNDDKKQTLGQKIIKAIIVIVAVLFASGAWGFLLAVVGAAGFWYPIGVLVIALAIPVYAYRDETDDP